jgi:ribosome-binding factor A
MSTHHAQLQEQLAEVAATYVNTWSNRQSLITITRAVLNDTEDRITFYVSVFPEDAEGPAIGFLMRKRGECRTYIKEHTALGRLPHVEFVLDEGEKKRRRVDELLQS